MHDQQGGVCAVCEQPETGKNQFGTVSLAIDHDHDTGEIRKLLCMRCNRSLGLLRDSIQVLERMIDYLKEHGK